MAYTVLSTPLLVSLLLLLLSLSSTIARLVAPLDVYTGKHPSSRTIHLLGTLGEEQDAGAWGLSTFPRLLDLSALQDHMIVPAGNMNTKVL
jgi:hypothetical protein